MNLLLVSIILTGLTAADPTDPADVGAAAPPSSSSEAAVDAASLTDTDTDVGIFLVEGISTGGVTLAVYAAAVTGSVLMQGVRIPGNLGAGLLFAAAGALALVPPFLSVGFLAVVVTTAAILVGPDRALVVGAAGASMLLSALMVASVLAAVSAAGAVAWATGAAGTPEGAVIGAMGSAAGLAAVGVVFTSPFVISMALGGGPLVMRSVPALGRYLAARTGAAVPGAE